MIEDTSGTWETYEIKYKEIYTKLAKKLGKRCSPKELNYKKPKFQIWTIDL